MKAVKSDLHNSRRVDEANSSATWSYPNKRTNSSTLRFTKFETVLCMLVVCVRERMCVCVCVRERENVCVRERETEERMCERERERECVCVWDRERERMCVCETERERMCVCVRERETENEKWKI
jgi:hypothetical protein